MITRRNIIWQVPLIFLLTFPLWKIPLGKFLSPRGGYNPEFSQTKNESHNFVLDKINILQNQDGKKTADIRANKAYTGPQPNELILENVDADIIDVDGIITHIRAQQGFYNTESKELRLTNKVEITRPHDSYMLFTENLYYSEATRKISCPGNTRLLGNKAEIKGTSLEYDINKGSYKIGGRVYCTFNGFTGP